MLTRQFTDLVKIMTVSMYTTALRAACVGAGYQAEKGTQLTLSYQTLPHTSCKTLVSSAFK